jgi:flagellar protein FlgJ
MTIGDSKGMELKSGTAETLQNAGSFRADAFVKSSSQSARDKEELATRKVAREFEALFVGMMLKSMRETVGKDPITDGGHGEEVYRSLLDQEYARIITEHGGIGLSAMLEKQLIPPAQSSGENRSGTSHDKRNAIDTTGVKHENR